MKNKKMKTAKYLAEKIMRVLAEAGKFIIKSAGNPCKFRKNLAEVRLQEGEKRAKRLYLAVFAIEKTLGIKTERKKDKSLEEEEGIVNGLFRKARPPPRKRGEEQQKSF